ncbi:MAG TPA: peptidoglycan recognition family protein, partial [Nitriliruptorales bacterium]|nr:peptidoglycan recognition family protein [Nitriliruptorales bacterium]
AATGCVPPRQDREPALDAAPGTTPPTVAEREPAPRAPSHPEVAARSADRQAPTPLAVLCRAAWGAAPPSGAYASHRLRALTVHHTAVPHDDAREGPARVRQHQRHHLEAGFVDLAYHFVIDRDGHVYEGRPVDAPGETFTDYDPDGHFVPCLEGEFGSQEPSQAQVDALVQLLAWAAATYAVPPATIRGHRHYAPTDCPGTSLQRLVDDGSLQRRVTDRLTRGGVQLQPVCGEEGRDRIATIEAGRS